MWPVSARFLPALARSHAITCRAEVWLGGQKLGTVPIGTDGQVAATARNRVRRTLTVSVPESYYPSNPTDLLAPYGAQLRIWRGVDLGDTVEEVPVFTGRIDTVDGRQRYKGSCQVSASDPGADLNDARFEQPRAAPAGWSTRSEIEALITEAIPGASVSTATVNDGVIPSGLLWDKDRGQAVDDLAQSIGVEVWAGPDGGWHITKPATLDQAAVWTLTDGTDGTIVSDARTTTRKGVYSVVVVVIERPDGSTPIQVAVEDLVSSSPTYVGGPFGRVPRFYHSPLVTNEAQARTAGAALLAQSVGLTRTRQITCVPNPALEIGDRIDITVGGVIEQHIIDEFSLPLGADNPAMSITTRSVKPDDGDS
jgi:hypothetical protein